MVRRVLRRFRPSAVVILETEIWPNLYRESKRAGASLLMVNGAHLRSQPAPLSPRQRLLPPCSGWPDAIFAQTEEDARRFVIAGAPVRTVTAAGNLKYDFNPPASGMPPDIAAFLESAVEAGSRSGSRPAPCRRKEPADPDEDDAVISAFSLR